jgi:hypothetical protein
VIDVAFPAAIISPLDVLCRETMQDRLAPQIGVGKVDLTQVLFIFS